ncbi:MAG TPA: 2-isopropylmalate synthase [Candidatus Desulfofervidus auxilii]|uniref:2-isopropylmalate synthase n=1 Tax=Desulfofervidus auxilii TaxID=1621989 RepID=A0A7C0Y9B4_DESA2|nr:2-isopropylmalate synthase [Candidatus Desulfofervidus auxilii]
MARRILIFDTTLRDGEQVPGAKLNIDQKLIVAKQLEKLGVDIIEAGFPASSPGDARAVNLVAQKVRKPIIAGLARALKRDIDILWEAIKDAERPRIHVFLAASDIHIEKKLRLDRQRALEMAVEAVKYAKKYCSDVEFSPEDATRADFDYLCQVVEETIKAGATVINIPDTVGYAIPEEFGELIRRLREKVPVTDKIILSVHCHNDLGLATANSIIAIRNGATQVECTINGIGERAGNAALEEIVMILKTRPYYFEVETNIVTQEIIPTSRLVSRMMNLPVQPNKAIVGSNAFAHSSGIHQDGILKDRRTYEIIRPEDVGAQAHLLVLTARSGRRALKQKLTELGYELSDEIFERTYNRFLAVADRKKEITAEDLKSIVEVELSKVPETYSLVKMVVTTQAMSGNDLPLAILTLSKGEENLTQASVGNGPVDAVFKCINQITGLPINLLDYTVEAVTSGAEALGEATVKIEINGQIISGRGTSPDVIEASARAYLNAVNRYFALYK